MRLAFQVEQESPVRDGQFKGNWIGSYGTMSKQTFETNSRDAYGQMSLYLNANSMTNEKVFYYTNSLPYAKRLANGWSAQADAGWIHVIARNFPRYVKEEANKLK